MQTVSNDEELKRLFHEQAAELPLKDIEFLVAVNSKISIAGKQFPAPSAASLCLLEMIDSPFVVSGDDEIKITLTDAFEALYVIRERQDIVPVLLEIKERQLVFERIQEKASKETDSGLPDALAQAESDLNVAREYFSMSAMTLMEYFLDDDPMVIINDVRKYISMAGGYDMLPSKQLPPPKAVRRRFDLDWLTYTVSNVSEVTNAEAYDIMWTMPLSAISYFIVQSMRKAGVRGIAERKNQLKP